MRYLRNNHWRFVVAASAVAMGVYLTITPPPGTHLATLQALERKLPECRFDQIPLIDVLSFVEQVGAVSVKCDQDALRVDQIDAEKLTVTALLRDARAREALDVALAQHRGLRYYIDDDDGSVIVTTRRGDANRAVTHVHNISDLLRRDGSVPPTAEQEAQFNHEVVTLLSEGGLVAIADGVGWMTLDKGILRVHQTPEQLERVGRLLRRLREGMEMARLRRLIQEDAP